MKKKLSPAIKALIQIRLNRRQRRQDKLQRKIIVVARRLLELKEREFLKTKREIVKFIPKKKKGRPQKYKLGPELLSEYKIITNFYSSNKRLLGDQKNERKFWYKFNEVLKGFGFKIIPDSLRREEGKNWKGPYLSASNLALELLSQKYGYCSIPTLKKKLAELAKKSKPAR